MKRIIYTRHGRDALRKRHVKCAEVRDVINNYDVCEPHDGCKRYKKGDLVVVVDEDETSYHIITILLRSSHQWTDRDVKGRDRA